MGFFFNRNKKSGIPRNAAFRITQEGREKLQEFSGDAPSKVLMALETRGTCDIDEITETSGVPRGQVERLIKSLSSKGYIQYVSSGMGAEVD